MVLTASRFVLLAFVLSLACAASARANPIAIGFSALIGTSNSIDTGNVFGEGVGANLRNQTIAGMVTIDPTSLRQVCNLGGACYGDFGAGAISVSFTLNEITSTVVSTGRLGYLAGSSGGLVAIGDRLPGGFNYLAVGAASEDGTIQESIGVLFNRKTAFSTRGGPTAAIDSLGMIGGGLGLVEGGITFMSPIEHLDATIMSIHVAEPAAFYVLGMALILLALTRRIVNA